MRGRGRWVAVVARLAVATLAVLLVALAATPASATITGPCTADLNGTDVTSGHDTVGSAVHVDYRTNAIYSGHVTGGVTASSVDVNLEVAGLDIRKHSAHTDGTMWSDTIPVKKYAWAGIGAYHVTGTVAPVGTGPPICTGAAYVCVDGKFFLLTVVGGVAAALGLLALYMLVRGMIGMRWRSRLRVAYRFGGAGLFGGIAAPVLLQQSCVVPLTQTIALASVGGGLVGMVLLGFLLGGRGRRRAAPEAPPVAPVAPEPEREREQKTVYRFVASEDACQACKNHAAHRIYRSAEAAAADRAHDGCDCEITSEVAHDPFLVAKFGTRDVIDDREGV